MEDIVTDKKEKHRLACIRWRAKNKEYVKEYNAKWKKERGDFCWHNYYSSNLKIKEKSNKKYRLLHPEKDVENHRRRRAKNNNIEGGHFTEKEWKELLEHTGHKCLCCGATDKPLHRDHVIPLVFGLPHSDEISNIQPLCEFCNLRKHTKIIDYRNGT